VSASKSQEVRNGGETGWLKGRIFGGGEDKKRGGKNTGERRREEEARARVGHNSTQKSERSTGDLETT